MVQKCHDTAWFVHAGEYDMCLQGDLTFPRWGGLYFWDSERQAVQAIADVYKKYHVALPHEEE